MGCGLCVVRPVPCSPAHALLTRLFTLIVPQVVSVVYLHTALIQFPRFSSSFAYILAISLGDVPSGQGLTLFSVWKSQQVFLVTLTIILPCFQPSNSDTVFLIVFLANEQAALHFSLSVFCAGHLRAFQPYFFSYKLYPFLQIIIMGSTMACWVCLLDIFMFTAWPIGIAVGGMYIT